MRCFRALSWRKVALIEWLCVVQLLPTGCIQQPAGEPTLAEQREDFSGTIAFSTGKIIPFTLTGTEEHIGQYTAHGEVQFQDGAEAGTLVGEGVAVFETPEGDKLVGAVTWEAGPESDGQRESNIRFSWRDSVQFSDGSVVATSGHFVDDRPPGLVVIAIIAILIGMLLPAVQK